ncbi:DEDDh family exonuclease [Streptomyces aidingensis]|uniref:DNA polymerase-3 subunit epsilon n=1 Tax=Streptomyces aidingensis TaxID=910347 RepID=A0A1I1M0N0_9ACTN|nr:DEDDh family exonuclease [Streptomyces aidingensis]SFC78656.1 DNA polymerase-3 subunit epsilon [Streptomyces aidingensis]
MLDDHQPAGPVSATPRPAASPPAVALPAPAAAPGRHGAEAAGGWPRGYPSGYAVVDVETTGLRRDDRIVSAAVYRLDARGRVEDHWYTLVNPQRDPGPSWLHGLTADMLADAPLFTEIAREFAERLAGRVLVAHNAVFDWTMIAREYARARGRAPVRQRLCTIALAKELALPLANYRLETLAAYYGVVQRRAHHALDDARVLAEAFRPALARAARGGLRLPLLACLPITEWSDTPGPQGSWRPNWRRSRRRDPCPYPNPGRYVPGGPLVQGMRVAFSGDTSVDRELLEDQAYESGLHIAQSVSRRTSLLVTNDPESATGKVRNAREYGTPVLDEAAFTQLLREVVPQGGTGPGPGPERGAAADGAGC